MKYFKGVLVLLVAALLLGCPGGGSDGGAGTGGGASGAAGGGQAGGAGASGGAAGGSGASGGAGAGGSGGAGGSAAGDASGDFQALVANTANLEYNVQYHIASNYEGESMSYEYSIALKNKNMMMHTYIDYQGEVMDSWSYVLDNKVYGCNNYGGEMVCLTLSEYEEDLSTSLTSDVESNPGNYDISNRPSRTVAGITAKCFGLGGPQMQGASEVCYSPEGVPLYMRVTQPEGEFLMEATSAQIGNVPDSVFELPVEPTSIEDMWGTGTYG